VTLHELSRTDARRIAVTAQLLTADRPTDVVDVVRHLTLLQMDLTAAVAPNADLVSWSRIGSSYDPDDLVDALDSQQLIELQGFARPAEDIALYQAEMAAWPGSGDLREWQVDNAQWIADNGACHHDVLELLRADGPLTSREVPDTCVRPWRSSGWTNNQNVIRMLDFMIARGEVAVVGRRGRDRLFDLAERIYPDDPVPSEDEALRVRNEKRLHALGIARARSTSMPGEPNDVGAVGEEAVVEGVKGRWRVDPAYLGQPFRGRAVLLSPLDRLVQDRKRTFELFDFEYFLEMYKPVDKRRWGYFALPVLYGDRFVGKLDSTADRKEGAYVVHAFHEDGELSSTARAAILREIEDLATWLELELVLPPSMT
jgi:uncharacterized protein YcaQ